MRSDHLRIAARVIKQGGIVAYATESCFGLGCDPRNIRSVQKIVRMKKRAPDKGLILIADHFSRFGRYLDHIPEKYQEEVFASWPGPYTWLIPAKTDVSFWLRGQFETIAVRVTAHRQARRLCQMLGSALVSTSANKAGRPSLKTSQSVIREFGSEIDYVLPGLIGKDATPSTIRDSRNGNLIRM